MYFWTHTTYITGDPAASPATVTLKSYNDGQRLLYDAERDVYKLYQRQVHANPSLHILAAYRIPYIPRTQLLAMDAAPTSRCHILQSHVRD